MLDWIFKLCYQTELESACLMHSKANLLIPSCGEGKYSIYCRHQARSTAAHAQKSRTPWRLSSLIPPQEAFLKTIFGGEGFRMNELRLIGWWWGNRVVFRNLNHKPSGSNWPVGLVLVLNMWSPNTTWVRERSLSWTT